MNEYTELFNNTKGAVDKRMLNVGLEDRKLLCRVFPEWGMLTNLGQFLFRDAADKLRELNIADAKDAQEKGYSLLQFLEDVSWKNKQTK